MSAFHGFHGIRDILGSHPHPRRGEVDGFDVVGAIPRVKDYKEPDDVPSEGLNILLVRFPEKVHPNHVRCNIVDLHAGRMTLLSPGYKKAILQVSVFGKPGRGKNFPHETAALEGESNLCVH